MTNQSDDWSDAIKGTVSLEMGSKEIPQLTIEPFGNGMFQLSLDNMPTGPLCVTIKVGDEKKDYLILNGESKQIPITIHRILRKLM